MARKLFFLLCVIGYYYSFACSLELKQVLILSRHNLRTPIDERLQTMSPKTWLRWEQAPAQLTKKGAVLEGYLGEYFSDWLKDNGLINQGCPKDSIHVYANTRQRTKDTAKAFIDAAFRNCNIPVLYKNTIEMDPVFNPVIHNTTEAFKKQVLMEINTNLNKTSLLSAYLQLNLISDIKDSQICKEQSYCDLASDKNEILNVVGMEPDIVGPLFISNAMVDAFLMAFYEGFPLKDIAWGGIKTEQQLELLTKVLKDYQSVRFYLPKSSKDFAKPLIQYIQNMFSSNKILTLLVGHDSNLNSVISALGFKSFKLPGQMEISPIGAKLVFQRWSDDGDNDFLKVEYVYESWSQIRNEEKLSMLNPPKNITMFFNNLTDQNGFYNWNDFETILKHVTE